MQHPRAWALRAFAVIALSSTVGAGCKPSPTKVVEHYLSLRPSGDPESPSQRIRRSTLIINANRLRHEDPDEYALAARCVLDLQSAQDRPSSECERAVRRMFGERVSSGETERAAPTQTCVYSPTSDARCTTACQVRCGRRPDPACFGPCVIEAAIRINSAIPGCGTSF